MTAAERAAEERYLISINRGSGARFFEDDSVDQHNKREAFVAGAAWQAEQSAPMVDREALAKWFYLAYYDEDDQSWWDDLPVGQKARWYKMADRMIASGIVRDAAEVRREVIDWMTQHDLSHWESATALGDAAREHFGIEER